MSSWMDRFHMDPASKFMVKIEKAFILDTQNLRSMKRIFPNCMDLCEMVLSECFEPNEFSESSLINAVSFYGLIHAKFLRTPAGLNLMHDLFFEDVFPSCPRVLCMGIKCLPYGPSDDLYEYNIKMFCPNCFEVYNYDNDPSSILDGSFFGPSWVHYFTRRYSDVLPKDPPQIFTPRIFGLRVARKG